jgi:Costars
VEGSKTDLRGKKAMAHVAKEILELCEIIDQCGHELPMCEDRKYISFGELFNVNPPLKFSQGISI